MECVERTIHGEFDAGPVSVCNGSLMICEASFKCWLSGGLFGHISGWNYCKKVVNELVEGPDLVSEI